MVIMGVPRLVGAPDACVSAQLGQAAAAAMAVQDAKITEGQLTNGRTNARSSARTDLQQRFGSVWTKSFHDASPVINLNAAAAPEWSAALDIDRQLAAGNPFAAATHDPFKASDTNEQSPQADRRLYQPPVELVVLHSQLQRLGPSTPFRYTAVSAPVVSPKHLQQPLLSPVRSPAGASRQWAADAGTQTLPAWLAADAERLGEGQLVNRARPASASPSRQQHASRVSARPGTAGGLHGSKHSTTSSPWRLVDKHAAASGGGEPWVPAGSSDGGVKQQVVASSAAAWAAKAAAGIGNKAAQDVVGRCTASTGKAHITGDSCGDWRTCNPTSRRRAAQRARERSRQQFEASAKYAAIGRAAARENAAAAAAAAFTATTESQPQHQQSNSPAGQIVGSNHDIFTASRTAGQLQKGTYISPVLTSRRFKTIPPPTQPWRPAGTAHAASQLPSVAQEIHTALPAKPAPSSLRALINRTKQHLGSGPRQPGGADVLGVLASDGLGADDGDWLRSDSSSSQSADTIPEAVMHERLESAAIMDGLRDLAVLDALTAHSDLENLQALLEETSSQEDTRSGCSWQLPAGRQAASAAAEGDPLLIGSTVSTSLVAASSPVQQHEEGLSAAVALDSPRPLTADHLSRLAGPQAGVPVATVEGQVVLQSPERQPGSPGVQYNRIDWHRPISRRPGSPGVRYNHIDLQSPTRRAATAGQAPSATGMPATGQAAVKVEDDSTRFLHDLALACNTDSNFPPASVGSLQVATADVSRSTQAIHVPAAAATCVNTENDNSMALSTRVLATLGPDLTACILDRPEIADSSHFAAAPGAQPLRQRHSDQLPNTGSGANQGAADGMGLNKWQPGAVALAATAASTPECSVKEHSCSMLAHLDPHHSSGSSDGVGNSRPSGPVANYFQDVQRYQALAEDSALAATAAAAVAASPDQLVLDEQDLIGESLVAVSRNEASRHGSMRPSATGYLKPSSDASCCSMSITEVNGQHFAGQGQEDISALESILQMELNDLDLEFASLEERLITVATTAQHVPAELSISQRHSNTSVSDTGPNAASHPLYDHSSELVVGDMQQSTSSVSMLPLRYLCHEGGDADDVRSHSVRFSSMDDSDVAGSIADSDVSDSDSVGSSK